MDTARIRKHIHTKTEKKCQENKECPVIVCRKQNDKNNIDIRIDRSQKIDVAKDQNLNQNQNDKPCGQCQGHFSHLPIFERILFRQPADFQSHKHGQYWSCH